MTTASLARPLSPSRRRSPLAFILDLLLCASEINRVLSSTSNPTSPETIAELRKIVER